jgi:hypothetical protein
MTVPVNRYNKVPELADIIRGLDQRLKSIERRSVSSVTSATTFMQAEAPWPDNEGPGGDHATAVGTLWIDPENDNQVARWSDQGQWAPARDLGVQQALDSVAEVVSDGLPPTSSPDPISLAGIGIFILKWTPITNHDTVTYEVHVSTTLGFNPTPGDTATLVGTTGASQFTVKRLPGPLPTEGTADPYALDYDTTYYARIIATDVDGAASPSLQAVCTVFRVTGVDIQADSITAANILAGTLTGDLFSATVIMAGTFKTAESGQRVETGTAGIMGYKSDGSLMVSIPTADGQNMLLDGEFIARKITVTGGISVEGTDNHIKAGASWTLDAGIVSPAPTPVVGISYDYTRPDTSTLTEAQKTGSLGTFDLVPDEVYAIEWKDFTTDYWVLHQVRTNGTRAWFFRVDNGAPFDIGSGVYFTDYVDWAVYSVWQITASSNPAKNGVYRMARWIPSGTANQYYLWSPFGLNKYSRQNGTAHPALVSEGNDIGVLEVINTDDLSMRFFTPNGDGNNLSAPFSSYTSTTGFSASSGLCTGVFDASGFGVGTGRYAVAHRGTNANVQHLTVSAGLLYPGGSGNNWASANKNAETWEAPTSNRRGFAWDAANGVFWTYGGDGYMYKHTSEVWDPAVSSSTYWAKHTYYDSNATGGTHETTPGNAKWYTASRRAKNVYYPPTIPTGGTDDPDKMRLYMARGNVAPANTAYHLQAEVTGSTTFQTLATATANPPTTNNFPTATPGMWVNNTGELQVSGDGTGTFKQLFQGASGSVKEVLANPPYYYASINSAPAAANGVITNISGYDAATISSLEITRSTDTFTIPRAGRYRFYGQLYWGVQATPVGDRIAQWILNGTTLIVSHTVSPSATSQVVNVCTRVYRVAANDTVVFRYRQTAGGNAGPVVSSSDLSFITISYEGP